MVLMVLYYLPRQNAPTGLPRPRSGISGRPTQIQTGQTVRKGADMEQERKQEYIGRLTLELLAYDSGAIGEAVKCRLSGADPDRGKKRLRKSGAKVARCG